MGYCKIIVRVVYRVKYDRLLDLVSRVEGLSSRVEYYPNGKPANLKELAAEALRSMGADWEVYARGQVRSYHDSMDSVKGTIYLVVRTYDVCELRAMGARDMLTESEETKRLKDAMGIACSPDLTVETLMAV